MDTVGHQGLRVAREEFLEAQPWGAQLTAGRRGCRVTKVRQFQKLAELSGRDGHLQQRLKQLLKLSKEKWDAACEHALTAVNVRPVARSSEDVQQETRQSFDSRYCNCLEGHFRLRSCV